LRHNRSTLPTELSIYFLEEQKRIVMAKVLIVDDMQAELLLMSQHLTKAGHSIITAADGHEALKKATSSKPDLIITDWMMPNMGGMDLCRQLKKNPETANIPVVACTVKNRDVDRLWATKQGIKAYVTKPYTAEELINAVNEVMR
jgi:two-component system, chemotaxis family, response regulator PixH